MADDNSDDKTQDTPPQTAPAPQSPASTIPPDIEALIAERVKKATDAVWAESRRKYQEKSKPKETESVPQVAPPQQADFAAEITRHTAFTRAMSKFDLSDTAFNLVHEEFARAKPENPHDWVAQRAGAFGWKPIGSSHTPQTQPQQVTEKVAPTAPPPVMPGSSMPAPRSGTEDMPILDMSETDREALVKKLGYTKFRERFYSELRNHNVRFTKR